VAMIRDVHLATSDQLTNLLQCLTHSPSEHGGQLLLMVVSYPERPIGSRACTLTPPPQPPRPKRVFSGSAASAIGPRSGWRRWLARLFRYLSHGLQTCPAVYGFPYWHIHGEPHEI